MDDRHALPERTQLDRIEGQLVHVDAQVGQVLQRLSRVEERQDNQGATVEAHRIKLDSHEGRIGKVELQQAVQQETQTQSSQKSDGRWSNAGAVALVIFSSLAGAAAFYVLNGGGQ